MKLKKYKVWFNQINQAMVEVKAETEEEAIKKASKYWKKEYGIPYFNYMEESTCEKQS